MARASFYSTAKLGPKRSLTPEGYLLCEEVPLARTGLMIYGPDETPIKPGQDGIVKITRDDADLFNPRTLGSANGKSVTVDHPAEDVVPANWKEHEVGVCIYPRRGEGAQDDLMLGDLLVKDPEGIKAIQERGYDEISLGYDADYEETGVGTGRQSDIIINHIALVQQGRCGPRCSIGDRKPAGVQVMPTPKKTRIVDALRRAFKAKDEGEVERIAEEVHDELEAGPGGEGEQHIHIHTGDDEPPAMEGRSRFTDDDIESALRENSEQHEEFRSQIAELRKEIEALKGGRTGDDTPAADPDEGPTPQEALDELPEELQKDAAKARDSAFFKDSFQDTVSLAEILVPGIRVPTFDAAAKPGATFKRICGFRRQALDLAYAQPATRGVLDELLGGKKMDTSRMTCDAVRTLFRSAAAAKKALNNGTSAARATDTTHAGPGKITTLADLNARNAAHWAKK